MHPRLLGILFLTSACGSAAMRDAAATPPQSAPAPDMAESSSAMVATTKSVAVEDADAASDEDSSAPAEAPAQSPAPPPPPGAPAPVREGVMLDIEAHVDVSVEDVRRAAAELRRMVSARGGLVTQESIAGGVSEGEATLTLRVPAGDSNGVVSADSLVGRGDLSLYDGNGRR